MSSGGTNLFCYWGGEIVQTEEGISYNGAFQKAWRVRAGTSYAELLEKMYKRMGISPENYNLRMTCRFPWLGNTYKALPVEDDDSTEVMLTCSSVELYVETILKTPCSTPTLGGVSGEVNLSSLGGFGEFSAHGQQSIGVLHQSLPHEVHRHSFHFEAASQPSHAPADMPRRSFHLGPSPLQMADEGSHRRSFHIGGSSSRRSMEPMPRYSFDVSGASSSSHDDFQEFRRESVRDGSRWMADAHEGVQTFDDNVEDENEDAGEDEEIDVDDSDDELASDDEFDAVTANVCESGLPAHQPMSRMFTEIAPDDGELETEYQQRGIFPGTWDPECDEPYVGLLFRDKEMMKQGMRIWSIRRNVHFLTTASKSSHWDIRCTHYESGECAWRMRASRRRDHAYYQVGVYNGPHRCTHARSTLDHPQLTSTLIAHVIRSRIEAAPNESIKAVQELVWQRYEKRISYRKAWKGKQKAIASIFGSWKSSFKALPKFMLALQRFNPGSVVELTTTPSYDINGVSDGSMFDRMFFAFSPTVEGFRHCRPVIGVDATHLYGKYTGKIMVAMAHDANFQVFPVACAFVGEESTDTWSYFILNLRQDVLLDREGVCLVADRHGGILSSVSGPNTVWDGPDYVHRFCARHFLENFKTKFKGMPALHDMAREAIWAYQLKKFDKYMASIEQMEPEAHRWLMREPPEKWAQSHDGGRRYGAMTTNMAEVFNNVLKGARCLPITAAVQCIFYRVVTYFCERRDHIAALRERGSQFGPRLQARIQERCKEVGHSIVSFDTRRGLHCVRTYSRSGRGCNTQRVSLVDRYCDCGKWQSDAIPCSHVMAVCSDNRLNWRDYLSPYYNIDKYEATYNGRFYPLPDEAYWDEPSFVLLPNRTRVRRPGRPRSSRFRSSMDVSTSRARITCSGCQAHGHDIRTCPLRGRARRNSGRTNFP